MLYLILLTTFGEIESMPAAQLLFKALIACETSSFDVGCKKIDLGLKEDDSGGGLNWRRRGGS